MSTTITLRAGVTESIDASAITPNVGDIGKLPCWIGRGRVQLGELFEIAGRPSDDVRVEGDLSRVDGLGTGMASGKLTIDGSAGRRVGAGMSGGVIEVTGSVSDCAGMAMTGGVLDVRGAAGDYLGAPLPGASRGMTGGEIIVRGDAGKHAGKRVRRGLIVIGGSVAEEAAHAMIAGTILVGGRLGPGAGLWSKRGSVIALSEIEIPATYRYACTYRPPYLAVLLRYLQRVHHIAFDARFTTGRFKRWTGDIADVGKGEILQWTT
jgi:formylmethanofuran dehydrogenase subunit C